LKEELKQFLATSRTHFGNNYIHFTHNRRYMYQIEVPAEAVQKVDDNKIDNKEFPHSFVLVGKVKGGRKRYVCDRLLELSRKL
jgi:hypothetical protein